MQAVITDLAEYHEVDLSQEGARFSVARPEHDDKTIGGEAFEEPAH